AAWSVRRARSSGASWHADRKFRNVRNPLRTRPRTTRAAGPVRRRGGPARGPVRSLSPVVSDALLSRVQRRLQGPPGLLTRVVGRLRLGLLVRHGTVLCGSIRETTPWPVGRGHPVERPAQRAAPGRSTRPGKRCRGGAPGYSLLPADGGTCQRRNSAAGSWLIRSRPRRGGEG